jgi:hypothetical protein
MNLLRRIFGPDDARRIAEHAAKFEALPAMAPVPGAFMPDEDGDIAQIRELIASIFGELDDRFTNGGEFSLTYSSLPGDHIYQALLVEHGLTWMLPGFRDTWADQMPELLAQWPARVVTLEVVS